MNILYVPIDFNPDTCRGVDHVDSDDAAVDGVVLGGDEIWERGSVGRTGVAWVGGSRSSTSMPAAVAKSASSSLSHHPKTDMRGDRKKNEWVQTRIPHVEPTERSNATFAGNTCGAKSLQNNKIRVRNECAYFSRKCTVGLKKPHVQLYFVITKTDVQPFSSRK